MTNRISIYKNESSDRQFRHDVIRHRGTVQHLFFVGRRLFVFRNRASAEAIERAQQPGGE